MNSTSNEKTSNGLGKKVLQFVLFGGTLIFAFFIVALVWIFYTLPSPSELKSTFFRETQISVPAKPLEEGDISVPAPDEEPAQIGDGDSTQADSKNEKQSPQDVELILQELSDQQNGLSKACDALEKGNSSILAKPVAAESFNQALLQSIQSGNPDPGIESVLPALRYMFSFSSMQDLLATAQAAAGREEDFVKKVEFYSQIYSAYNELVANKAHLENVLDRSYLLFMMMKVAEKNPLVMQTSEAISYCRQIETAMNEGLAYQPQVESSEFLKFLESAQIRPEEIGYDPKQKTQLSLVYTDQAIQVKDTWLDQVFGGSQKNPSSPKPK